MNCLVVAGHGSQQGLVAKGHVCTMIPSQYHHEKLTKLSQTSHIDLEYAAHQSEDCNDHDAHSVLAHDELHSLNHLSS